ncbi:MAG: ABC transporter substrate-binding protein, partial [Lachnospiraceae bacterium]|nr:ABC transporter substrate-binding protein [Lachnospiraceae bacterium]
GLPVDSYIEKGILEDLTPILGSEKEKFLPNIVSVYSQEDKIYMLPLRVIVPLFMTSGQNQEKYSDLESLVEYSEEEGGVANIVGYSYENILQILYYNYKPDLFLGNGMVDREATAKFFSLVRRFCKAEQITETALGTTPYVHGYSTVAVLFAEGEKDLVFLAGNGVYSLAQYPASVKIRNGELVGNHGIFIPNGLLGVNRLSEKKEVANLFINFAFSYEIQNRHVARSGYPIHMKLLEEYAQMDLSYLSSYNGKISLRWYNAEESAQLVQIVKEAHTPVTIEENIWEILLEVAENYLKDKKGLDESVDEFASRLQLYLFE